MAKRYSVDIQTQNPTGDSYGWEAGVLGGPIWIRHYRASGRLSRSDAFEVLKERVVRLHPRHAWTFTHTPC